MNYWNEGIFIELLTEALLSEDLLLSQEIFVYFVDCVGMLTPLADSSTG